VCWDVDLVVLVSSISFVNLGAGATETVLAVLGGLAVLAVLGALLGRVQFVLAVDLDELSLLAVDGDGFRVLLGPVKFVPSVGALDKFDLLAVDRYGFNLAILSVFAVLTVLAETVLAVLGFAVLAKARFASVLGGDGFTVPPFAEVVGLTSLNIFPVTIPSNQVVGVDLLAGHQVLQFITSNEVLSVLTGDDFLNCILITSDEFVVAIEVTRVLAVLAESVKLGVLSVLAVLAALTVFTLLAVLGKFAVFAVLGVLSVFAMLAALGKFAVLAVLANTTFAVFAVLGKLAVFAMFAVLAMLTVLAVLGEMTMLMLAVLAVGVSGLEGFLILTSFEGLVVLTSLKILSIHIPGFEFFDVTLLYHLLAGDGNRGSDISDVTSDSDSSTLSIRGSKSHSGSDIKSDNGECQSRDSLNHDELKIGYRKKDAGS